MIDGFLYMFLFLIYWDIICYVVFGEFNCGIVRDWELKINNIIIIILKIVLICWIFLKIFRYFLVVFRLYFKDFWLRVWL